jgi:hypothetical protein
MFSCFSRFKSDQRNIRPITESFNGFSALVAGIGESIREQHPGLLQPAAEPVATTPAPVSSANPEPKKKFWSGHSTGLKDGEQVLIDIFYLDKETYPALGYTYQERYNNTYAVATYKGDEELQPDGHGSRTFEAIFDIRGNEVRLTFYTCDL